MTTMLDRTMLMNPVTRLLVQSTNTNLTWYMLWSRQSIAGGYIHYVAELAKYFNKSAAFRCCGEGDLLGELGVLA